MAFNQFIDGTLRVLGNVTISSLTVTNAVGIVGALTVSNLTVSNSVQVPIAASFALNATALTLTGASISSAIVSAVTQNLRAGKLTTTALTAAAASTWTLVLTNSIVSTADLIFFSIGNGTATAANGPTIGAITPVAGAVTLQLNTVSALNGTYVISYAIFK